MEQDGEVEDSLSVVVQRLEDLKVGSLAERNIMQVKAALNLLCVQENKLLAILRKAKGSDDNAHTKEVEDVLKELRLEISRYMDHIAKVPHEEVVKAMQTQPASKEGGKEKREVEKYDELVVEEAPSYEPLPFRPSVAPSRTEGIESRRAELGPPEIPHSEIIFDRTKDLLGEGSFGSVFKGICRNKTVAIKEPTKQKLTDEELKSFNTEIKTMSTIFHPNVVLFLGASQPNYQHGLKLQIVMEYCPTDVEKLLKADRKLRKLKKQEGKTDEEGLLTMVERVKLAKDTALGLNWLHGICSLVHGDLKSANLLVDENRHVKVSDFGFAVVKKPNDPRQDPNPLGTPLYMAPEVMSGQAYDGFKADVYAFGLILWEICTSQKLFAEFSAWRPFKTAIMGGHRPEIPAETPAILRLLMQQCWDHNPTKRPSIPEVVFRLDEALVDVTIKDPEGRKFWKDHFLLPRQDLQEVVEWSEFVTVMAKQLGVVKTKIEPASEVLSQLQEDNFHVMRKQVSMSYFNRMIYTWGHFFLPPKGMVIVEEIIKLSKEKWFHFNIDRATAVERLKSRPEGTWLLRLREPFGEAPGCCPFVISHIRSKTVVNRIIQHNPTEPDSDFVVNIHNKNFKFKNLREITVSQELKLKDPCPPTTMEKERYATPSPPGSDSEEEQKETPI